MRVSIVVPCYNEEVKIEECIESLLLQKPDEIVVVDDGSTDRSRAILRNIKGIKFIELEKNMGPAYARNVGWKNSIGDIIVFRDADSVVSKDFISDVRSEFERTNADIIEFEVDPIIRDNANLIEKSLFYKEVALGGNKEIVIRKHVLEKVGGFDPELGFGEDRELTSKYKKFRIVKGNKRIQVYISRISGFSEYIERQLWYGRTMLAYIMKTKDKKVTMSYLYSVVLLISLLFSFVPYFYVLFLTLCVILAIRSWRIGYVIYNKYKFWQSFFILPGLEIIGRIFMGTGAIYGIILKSGGRYYVGR